MAAVRIVEVGPRDGLQNIQTSIPTATKLELIEKLRNAGLKSIEISLLLGLKVALENGIREVAVFVSATEGFSRANIKCSVAEGIRRAQEVATEARKHGITVRGYVSCIFADPYDGPTPLEVVHHAVEALFSMGCYEVSLGDTLGVGTPPQVRKYPFSKDIEPRTVAGHFHDTYGHAVANIWEAYQHGVRTFDSSIAGLGGCPFAPGAKGNVSTEGIAYLFEQAGIDTGVELESLVKIGMWISRQLGKTNGSRAGSALAAKIGPSRPPRKLLAHTAWSLLQEKEHILVYRCGANGKIVLNQPRKGNTLSLPLLGELSEAFRELEKDESISRIIITGKGKYFCTGMDLGEGQGPFGSDSEAKFQGLVDLFDLIDRSSKVTIASINGPAFGGGVGLAFSCDIRISVANATFTLSETKLGLCPAIISKYVVREWGVPRSREAILTARPVMASELRVNGSISTLAETTTELDLELDQLLQRMRQSAPGGSTMSKELVSVGWASPDTDTQRQKIAQLFDKMMMPDAESVHGVAEFRKKRMVD
ncbi:hypothetical protein NW765_017651 [Fusarium oxysporum]|nr:hypothetical protein NW765_017651 [Fusarium oxysporum]KAJ4264591.1 hypothetical protein NW764_015920 [Fusarium oxysporum]